MLLELQNPIYMQTSYFGHFTKDNLPWEKTNYVNKILEVINK
jgi:S-adenosylmethionine synthetase